MRIKVTYVDKLFSKYIKLRDNNTCRKCGKTYGLLDCAHIFSRRARSTRWSPENALLLCRGCHIWFTERPHEWADWTRKELGEIVIDQLQVKNRTLRKEDPEASAIWLRKAIMEFEKQCQKD